MKKILVFLIVLLLTGCTIKNEEIIDNSDKYIKPLNEVNFYSIINDDLKERLHNIYGNDNVGNNLIKMIGQDLIDISVEDYSGKTINFNDYSDKEIVLEVVQYSCEHCKKQVPLTETILENEDVVFIQYFAWGTKDQIDDFYSKAGYPIPKKLIVIPHDDKLSEYISKLETDLTPTFMFFKNGVLNFACAGDLSYSKYQNASDFAFNNPINKSELIDNEGRNVFESYRSKDDVLNDLSISNRDKFALIDNSEELTVEVIGKQVNYNELYEKEDEPVYIINDFNRYVNKPLVVFYVANINGNLLKDSILINDFIANHKGVNVLTILMDNKDLQTSAKFKEDGIVITGDIVSSNAELPKIFLDVKVNTYPAALFIQDNIIVGGINSIEKSDTLSLAYDTFVGPGSIALIENNR